MHGATELGCSQFLAFRAMAGLGTGSGSSLGLFSVLVQGECLLLILLIFLDKHIERGLTTVECIYVYVLIGFILFYSKFELPAFVYQQEYQHHTLSYGIAACPRDCLFD